MEKDCFNSIVILFCHLYSIYIFLECVTAYWNIWLNQEYFHPILSKIIPPSIIHHGNNPHHFIDIHLSSTNKVIDILRWFWYGLSVLTFVLQWWNGREVQSPNNNFAREPVKKIWIHWLNLLYFSTASNGCCQALLFKNSHCIFSTPEFYTKKARNEKNFGLISKREWNDAMMQDSITKEIIEWWQHANPYF